MCISCHSGLSDESVLEQLKSSLDKKDFTGWNETSISHACIAYIGVNGEEAKNVAEKLVLKYISWKKENVKQYDGSFVGEPTTDFVEQSIKYCDIIIKELKQNGIVSSEQIKHMFMSYKESSS